MTDEQATAMLESLSSIRNLMQQQLDAATAERAARDAAQAQAFATAQAQLDAFKASIVARMQAGDSDAVQP